MIKRMIQLSDKLQDAAISRPFALVPDTWKYLGAEAGGPTIQSIDGSN
jgi:hypothetical protein